MIVKDYSCKHDYIRIPSRQRVYQRLQSAALPPMPVQYMLIHPLEFNSSAVSSVFLSYATARPHVFVIYSFTQVITSTQGGAAV